MSLGSNIRANRERLGLDQSQLGKKVDRTKGAVSQWETDTAVPRMPVVRQLADLFGVTVSELMGESAERIEMAPSSTMMPILGYAHMGEPEDEGGAMGEASVPTPIADAHPNGFLVRAQGGCMDNRFPTDALLLIDPDMEPASGHPVLAETEDYGAVVRNYMRGNTYALLAADSHSGDYEDIMAGPDDPPFRFRGRVVWYMGERDER